MIKTGRRNGKVDSSSKQTDGSFFTYLLLYLLRLEINKTSNNYTT